MEHRGRENEEGKAGVDDGGYESETGRGGQTRTSQQSNLFQ